MNRKGVSRTRTGYVALAMTALTELAKEAIRRNDLGLAAEVLACVKDAWNTNVADSPGLAENRTFVAWFEWVQGEAARLGLEPGREK
jgi:hypothetical protein